MRLQFCTGESDSWKCVSSRFRDRDMIMSLWACEL